jgi:hypothetical protein
MTAATAYCRRPDQLVGEVRAAALPSMAPSR